MALYNVVIWNGTREVGIDSDGTEHVRLDQAECFAERQAHAVAKKFDGKVIDAFDDDDFDD